MDSNIDPIAIEVRPFQLEGCIAWIEIAVVSGRVAFTKKNLTQSIIT